MTIERVGPGYLTVKEFDVLARRVGLRVTIDKALRESLDELKLQRDVELIEIQKGHRVILNYVQDPTFPSFHTNMIKLEILMSQKVGRLLDLRLAEKVDKNKRAERTERV